MFCSAGDTDRVLELADERCVVTKTETGLTLLHLSCISTGMVTLESMHQSPSVDYFLKEKSFWGRLDVPTCLFQDMNIKTYVINKIWRKKVNNKKQTQGNQAWMHLYLELKGWENIKNWYDLIYLYTYFLICLLIDFKDHLQFFLKQME